MTRAELLEYAESMYRPLADETGIPLTDTPAGLAYQLDAAEEEIGDDADNNAAARALIEYHSLIKFRAAAAARPDFDATAKRGSKSQVYEQINALIADAARRCATAGHPTTTAATYGRQAVNLEIIEPDPLEALL